MIRVWTKLAVFLILVALPLGCDNAIGNNDGSSSDDANPAPLDQPKKESANEGDAPSKSESIKSAPEPKVTATVSGPSWSMPAEELTHNFGAVWAGETLRHTFEFLNNGTETLRVLEAKPRCSCSVADNYSKVVQPGEKGRMPFVLKTTNKHGKVHEYLDISLNDPKKPKMRINMVGEVKRVADMTVTFDSRTDPADRAAMSKLSKSRAFFGAVQAGEEVQRVISIRNTSGVSPLKLDLQDISGDKFVGQLEVKRPGELWEFFIFSQPPYNVGYNFTQFIFKTNIPEQPTWTIKASLELPPRVKIIPNRIVADANTYKNKQREIKIMNNGDTPIDVTSVACSDPNYKVTYLGPDPKNSKMLVVEVLLPPGEYRPPSYGEVVRIETTDAEKNLIEIMVLPELRRGATPRPADKPLEFYPGKLLG